MFFKMILGFIKKIVPVRVKAFVKMGSERKQFRELILKIEHEEKDYDVLLGTAIHTNLGDHLITLAEIQMMNEFNPQRKVYEIPSEMYQFYKRRLKKAIKLSTRIFINGGGWMGDLWPNEERLLQDMVYCFHKNKIVIFPQTIFYDLYKKHFGKLLKSGNKVFAQCTDIKLFVRDSKSYEFALKNLDVAVELVPDIALYYNYNKQQTKEKVVGLCMRDDREKSRDDKEINKIVDFLKEKGYEIYTVSTMNQRRVSVNQRKKVCDEKLNDFSKCSIVITDRLHGMIFSYLAGTACIVFDNKTQKISGVYRQWLTSCEFIFPAFDNLNMKKLNYFMDKNFFINREKIDLHDAMLPIISEVYYG